MKISIESLRKEIVEVGRRVYNRGYVASNDGNISARIDTKRILITPTGVTKGFMKPEDLIIVDLNGKKLSGKKNQSSESNMHLKIYSDRPDVMSVCHAHPPYATGFAVAGLQMDKMILPEVIISLGKIPIVEYGTPGTEELYQMISKYIYDFDAFLLENHGALTVGSSIFNAYHKMETLEHAAKIQFIAHQLGNVNTFNISQSKKLIDLRSRYGIREDLGLKISKKNKK